MNSSKWKFSFILLILCSCFLSLALPVSTVNAVGAGGGISGNAGGGGGGGNYTPHGGVGLPMGSFKLNQNLAGQNGLTCAYYNNFYLNANGGQAFKARLWTPEVTINYTIVTQDVFNSLRQGGCSYLSGLSSQIQSFSNSQITLNWTAPQTGLYVIFFYSLTPYSGQIFCLPQS